MNEPTSAITHLIAALLSVAALVLMVVYSTLYSDPWHIVGASIFGASLILLYTSSTVYHFLKQGTRAKEVMRRIDHSLIYVLIAGTYTPLCLGPLRGPWGWSLFGVVWGLAIVGIILKSMNRLNGWLSALIYVLMGWVVVVEIVPLLKLLSLEVFLWLFGGGMAYTIGVLFFALDKKVKRNKWFGMHEVFHLFVILGSFCHFWAVFSLY